MAPNKTDANDAEGLAHRAEVGFYREIRVKGFDSMLPRTLVAGRRQLLKMQIQMSNQISGLLKTFELIVPKGVGGVFDRNVWALLEDDAGLARIILASAAGLEQYATAGNGVDQAVGRHDPREPARIVAGYRQNAVNPTLP